MADAGGLLFLFLSLLAVMVTVLAVVVTVVVATTAVAAKIITSIIQRVELSTLFLLLGFQKSDDK